MVTTRTQRFRQLCGWVSNASTLFAIVALGIWGHSHHWKIPSLSELRRSSGATHGGAASKGSPNPTLGGAVRLIGGAVRPRIEFESADSIAASGIQIVTAEKRPLDEFVTANGVVTYNQNYLAQLSARVPGTVWRVEREVGQHVRKGDVLAILDAAEVGRAKAEFLQSMVQAELKRLTLERLKSVGSVIPERQIREAEADVREARIQRFNAQHALINLGLPIRIDETAGLSDDDLAKHVQFLGLPKELSATLDPETTTANLIPLKAAFDGVVIGREIVMGEVVQPAQSQFVVADVRKMWIELDVRKEDAVRLALGQEVRFVLDGVPGEVVGKLSWISTEVDQRTRTVQVRVEVENPLISPGIAADNGLEMGQRLLRTHSFGTGRIRVRQAEIATVVPDAAVQWEGTRHVVFVLRGEKTFEAHPVRPGISQEGFTEILSGLAGGERIVGAGSHLLKSEILRDRSAKAD